MRILIILSASRKTNYVVDDTGEKPVADVAIFYISASTEHKLGNFKSSFIQIPSIFYFGSGVILYFNFNIPMPL